MHGDLYVAQVDVSGQDTIQKTLFGDERRFDCIKPSPECRGIGAYQDWSQFLLATLKYAEKIGQAKHPDIVNWKEVLESIGGGVGTNTAECMFGNRNNDHTAEMLFMPELWNDKDTPKTVPLTVFNHGVKDAHFIPYVQEDKLIYLIENSKGEFTFNNRFFEDKKFRKCLEYTPEDIPQVLRGTYKYFARDRSMLSLILERFNQESH
jgi:hypothetical protein